MKKKKEPNGFAKLRRSTALPKWRFFIPNVPFRFRLFLSLIAASLYINSLPAQDSQYDPLHGRGEKEYAEGSYALAHETYEKCAALKLDPTVKRWVDFRLADTLWRAQAGSQTPDASNYEKAQDALQSLIRDRNREEDHDLVWAEAHESLGDFYWLRNDSRNWGTGWNFYQFALEWWAGSPDIESARERYIKIVKKIARPSWVEPYYYYGYYGNQAPMNVLENYLKIAQSANDKAQAHYLIAMTLRNQGGDWEQVRRVPEEFEAALEAGRGGDWYDDALFYYADWMATRGRARMNDEGQWIQEPDYVRALELYRRLLNELKKGETRYYDQAKAQIENITGAQLGLGVSNIF
ncbi:alpha-2-macroglobulin, partial [Candidatus Sumerlaeota bacterium]|nr:alpha-2-macroglobulin [Candidatus Sumerlaeota bacterium]